MKSVIFRERIAKLKAERGLTTEMLSELSGVPKGTINKILNGETKNPTANTVRLLAEVLNCSIESLCDDKPDKATDLQLSEPSNGLCYTFGARNLIPVSRRSIPMLGEIAAGAPIYAQEQYGVTCPCYGSSVVCDFALQVKGDSMIGARIMDGDIVFIQRQDDVEDGEIAAVIIDDEATLKRVYHIKNGLQLLSENPNYPPMIFTYEDHDAIRIIGKALGFQSRL